MLYRRLADLVVVMHMLMILFFLLGAVVVVHAPWLGWLHFPLALWVCAAFLMGWTCPLTPLEKRLREAAGARGYAGSFVDHYLVPLVTRQEPAGEARRLGRRNEILLGAFFTALNAFVYIAMVMRDISSAR